MTKTQSTASAVKSKGARAPRGPGIVGDSSPDETVPTIGAQPGYRKTTRQSRAANARENAAKPGKRPVITSAAPLNLPYIPARPGMDQRWGRVILGTDGEDVANCSRLEARGWTSRLATTLPAGIKAPTIRKGDYIGAIGSMGNVLMERPTELGDEQRDANRAAADEQQDFVNQQLLNEHRPGVKGLGRPKMRVDSSVGVRGKRPVVQEDDDEDV